MFGLGAWEIGMILLVALIFIGPKKLPEIAGQIGRGMRDIQRAANDFKREIAYPSDPPRYDPSKDPYRDLARKHAEQQADAEVGADDLHESELEGYPDEPVEDGSEGSPAADVETANAAPVAPVDEPSVTEPAPGEPSAAAPSALPQPAPAFGAVAFGEPEVASDPEPPQSAETTEG